MTCSGLLDTGKDFGVIDLAEREAQQGRISVAEILDEGVHINPALRCASHLANNLSETAVVPGRERDHIVSDEPARFIIEAAYDAEVEKADIRAVEQHQI